MKTTFEAVILTSGNNTGIEIPPHNLAQLGAGKRPPVMVTVDGYTYRSTVGAMGGRSLISFSKAHREASGLMGGEAVTVTLELEEGPRPVDTAAELDAAMQEAALTERFASLSYSKRKELARRVREAKTDSTRDRRIDAVLEALR